MACEQTISQPYVVGWMSQELDVKPHHRVLEVGTGSGYQTAILCELCPHVWSIERHPLLAEQARSRLAERGYHPHLMCGDGSLGWPEEAPFDRILVTAAAPQLPHNLLNQLSVHGGILVTPVGVSGGTQTLTKVIRTAEHTFETFDLGGVRFVPLVSDMGHI
jgi:protein-L-isoaspartate(D-aspartate) O-methyltransferase